MTNSVTTYQLPSAPMQPSGITISSLEIAERTGKRHDNVMADIRNMLEELDLHSPEFSGQYKDSTGRTLPCFNLPKREATILATGYDVIRRAQIIDCLEELEAQARLPIALPDFTNPAIAARAWADEVEQKQIAQHRVLLLEHDKATLEHENAIMEPKAEAYDDFLDSDGLYTMRDTAKKVGMRPKDLTEAMIAKGCLYRAAKKLRPTSSFASKGYATLVPKGSDRWYNDQLYITPKGLAWVVEKFRKPSAVEQ